MSDSKYCYPPDYTVLRNKLGLRDADELEAFEGELVSARGAGELPKGDFDLTHLRAIHKHLFQDVYDWAGEIRTVEISKGGSQFQPIPYIKQGMDDVHRRILEHNYLRNLSPEEFSKRAGKIIGDVNYVHPFREGNGRTQLRFYRLLAEQTGYKVDLRQLDRDGWIAASQQAHNGNYESMAKCLLATLVGKSK